MATLNTIRTGSLIDAAFLTPSSASSPRVSRFAANQEKAMANRLQQLHSALGEPAAPASVTPIFSTPQANPTVHGAARSRTGSWSMLLACILSAALGAASTWLFVGHDGVAPGMQQVASIAPVPATVIAEALPPAPPARDSVAAVAPSAVPDEIQIGDMLESWRQAWRDRDVTAYLDAYGTAFQPAEGTRRDAWVAARTKKLAGAAAITLELRDLQIKQLGQDQYAVSFLQDYASGSYREMGRGKILNVAREDGHWKIVREQQTP